MKTSTKKFMVPAVVREVDSNWSWIVCFASFLIQFIIIGIQSSFGTFFIEFLKEFKHGESSTAWIGSLSFGLTFMNGPLATALCSRYGNRTITCLGALLSFCGLMMTSFVQSFPLLYVTYGVVFGLGASFSYFASIAGLTVYFKKRLSLAYGIMLAGSGAGTPVMIVLLEYLIQTYGWRCTFQFAAAVTSVVFVGGLTYLPIGPPDKPASSKESPRADGLRLPSRACAVLRQLLHVFDPEPFKDRAFTIWVIALGFVIFGYFIPFVFVIRMAKDIGVSTRQSTLLIAYLAITQTFFKVLFGRLGDFAREKRITILQVFLLLQATVTILCPLASKYGYCVLVIYVVVFGLADGCWSVMIGMGTELIVGKAMMPRAFGSLYGLISIPLIVGPPIAGVIFDQYGSYDAAFVLAGITVIIGIVLMFVVQRLIRGRFQHELCDKLTEVKSDFTVKTKLVDDDFENMTASTTQVATHPAYLRCIADTELYSRPSSLVISRVLEDIQEKNTPNDLYLENFQNMSTNTIQVDTHHYLQCTADSELYSRPSSLAISDVLVDLQDKYNTANESHSEGIYSISSKGSIMMLNDEGSMNSDSGRSTYHEESENLQRSRPSSTDSDFIDDEEYSCQRSLSSLGSRGLLKTGDNTSLKLYFSQDIFSNLMEKALEAEVFPYVETCYQGIENCRETVL